MAMEIDVQLPLKQALAKAKTYSEAKDWLKAASAYEKAANLMSTWAEQAHGREAEERRKKMAIEYRQIAQRLRSGEVYSDTRARLRGGLRQGIPREGRRSRRRDQVDRLQPLARVEDHLGRHRRARRDQE